MDERGSDAGESGDSSASPGEYVLVGVEHDVEDTAAAALRALPDGSSIVHVNETLSYVAAVLPDDSPDRETVKTNAVAQSGIRYAEDNHRGHGGLVPNDPKWSNQYAPGMVDAPTAWDTTTGADSVTIAVLDSGIKYDHPDLSPNMDDDSHSAPSGASQSYDPSNHGWDFVSAVDQDVDGEDDEVRDNDPYPKDLRSNDGDRSEHHGTHVAGILGAVTDNGTGIAGISDCSILAVKGLDDDNRGWYADWADGMQWAADQGADVINMSLGGSSSTQTLRDGVTYAYNNGALLVAAAMNQSTDSKYYPAGYPEVMAVSALDPDGTLASYSNYGDHIELSAPGTDVLSTYTTDSNGDPADTYAELSGTSMATPVVSGIAGLVLSGEPNLTVEQVRHRLKVTAEDIGLAEKFQGAGRVHAPPAVTGPTEKWSHGINARHQFASPGVAQDHAVVGGLQAGVHGLKKTGGNVDWSRTRNGELADSSPTVEGSRVYVGGGGGTLYALVASDGSVDWSVSTSSAIVSTPTVATGDVYVGRNDGVVGSYDVNGGGTQWTTDVGAAVYSKPAFDGVTDYLFVTTRDGDLVALDTTASGSVAWRTSLGGESGHASPTVANGRVYAAADVVSARQPSDGSVVWQTDHGGTAGSTPVYHDGLVYAGSTDGSVYALDDANSGTVVWTYGTGGPVASTPTVADWYVVVGSDDGTVYVLDADTGDLLASRTVGRTASKPAVASDGVYVCTWNGSTVRVTNFA